MLFSRLNINSVVRNIFKKSCGTLWANPNNSHHEQLYSLEPGLQFTASSNSRRSTESVPHCLQLRVYRTPTNPRTASAGKILPIAEYVPFARRTNKYTTERVPHKRHLMERDVRPFAVHEILVVQSHMWTYCKVAKCLIDVFFYITGLHEHPCVANVPDAALTTKRPLVPRLFLPYFFSLFSIFQSLVFIPLFSLFFPFPSTPRNLPLSPPSRSPFHL